MNKTKNALSILFSAILITIFVAMPLFQKFLETRQSLEVKKEELRREDIHIGEIKAISRELEEYTPTLELIDRAIPNNPEIPSLILYLEDFAGRHGMRTGPVGGFSINPSRQFPGLKEIKTNLSISGSYSDINRFIYAVENSGKIIDIESFSLSPPAEEGEGFSLRATIKTYSY